MTRSAEIAKTTIDLGYAITRGEPYELMLTSQLASLFGIDAGAAFDNCPTNLWSATVATAEPLTGARIKQCAEVAPRQPVVRAAKEVGVKAPIHISNLVTPRASRGSQPDQAMHSSQNGRCPTGEADLVHSARPFFVGIQRTRHDFTDNEMDELATVERVIVAALRFRREVDQLISQLPAVGARDVSTETGSKAPAGSAGSRLTPREIEILAFAAMGWTNHHIGSQLGITERTVRKHLTSIYAKIQTSGRSAAVAWWERHAGQYDSYQATRPLHT